MKKPALLLAVDFTVFVPLGAKAQNTDSAKKPTSFSAKVAGNARL